MLLHSGGRVTVVAPRLCATLKGKLTKAIITHVQARFSPRAFGQAVIVIAATNDRAANQQVSEVAKAQRIPVNVVDDPEFCSFIMPSVIDRSPVDRRCFHGGTSPVLARLLRAKLETLIPGRLWSAGLTWREIPRPGKSKILPNRDNGAFSGKKYCRVRWLKWSCRTRRAGKPSTATGH